MSEAFLANGVYLVAVYDAYDSKREMVEPKLSWLVHGEEKAVELVQFVQAFLDTKASDYGDAFVAKVWLPSWVTPSVTMLGQAREELSNWLEEVSS